jgi:hypothetical protein
MRVRPLFLSQQFSSGRARLWPLHKRRQLRGLCDTPELRCIFWNNKKATQQTTRWTKFSSRTTNCMKLHVTAVGIHQVGELRTFLKKRLVFSRSELLQFYLFRQDQNHISGLKIRYWSTLPFL